MRIRGTYVNVDDGNYMNYSLHFRFILINFLTEIIHLLHKHRVQVDFLQVLKY